MFTIGQLITPIENAPTWDDQAGDMKTDATPGETFVYDGVKVYLSRHRYKTARRLIDGRVYLLPERHDLEDRFEAI